MSEVQSQEAKSVAIRKVTSIRVDDDENTTLHYAAANGDEETVRREITDGHKIDTENYLGWTPLMMAVRNNRFQITKLLIENRADATKVNRFGMNVFIISITTGRLEMVTFLLQHLLCGGISRQSIQKIISPLFMAILFKNKEIVRYLIDMSFDINYTIPVTGITPTMIAAAMKHKDIYELLVEKGADLTKKNILGQTVEMQTKIRKPKLLPEKICMPQIPVVIFSPQPSFFCFPSPMSPDFPNVRKSSNTVTPSFVPPNITPIAPPMGCCSQFFFPPDFSPNQPVMTLNHLPPVSPMVPNVYLSNDVMNMRMSQSGFLSPYQYVSPRD